jgi:hypothetical protein
MIHYCTHFDRNYLPRALILYRSLIRYSPPFTLWVLCLDTETYSALKTLDLPMIRAISMSDFERGDAALVATRSNRSTVEYYFTCTPSLPLYVLRIAPEIDMITYLDADLKFFASPEVVFDEVASSSIGIVPHLFQPKHRDKEKFGRFNVGLLVFRNDATGRACLMRWREQCIDWCYDKVETDRYADQKYLDSWPDDFGGVRVLENPGAVMGPWNFGRYDIRVASGRLLVNGDALVFYHYAGFRPIRSWLFDLGLGGFGRMQRAARMFLYRSYIRELRVEQQTARIALQALPSPQTSLRGRSWRNRARTFLRLAQGALMFGTDRFWL